MDERPKTRGGRGGRVAGARRSPSEPNSGPRRLDPPYSLRLAHSDETPVILTRKCPEKRSHVGAFVEEADRVDADPALVPRGSVPIGLKLLANVLAQNLAEFGLLQVALLLRGGALALVG